MEKEKLVWKKEEYAHKEKSTDWFWAVGIIFISITAIAFIYENKMFGIFLFIAGATLLLQATKKPKEFTFEINDSGINIGRERITYPEIKAFWVEKLGLDDERIILRTNRPINHITIIPIDTFQIDAEEVRKYLRKYLPEERMYIPLSQRIMEYFGF